jgi:ABC-type nitrate/sulfonate/bicarbonate transport system permease component
MVLLVFISNMPAKLWICIGIVALAALLLFRMDGQANYIYLLHILTNFGYNRHFERFTDDGLLMDRFETFYLAFEPLMTVSQTIPTIAIAPILVLWMGFGMAPKITLVVITTFFPIAIGLLDGFKRADPDAVALLKSMNATRGQIFRHVKLPAALPHFFSGLRVSASYAVVGAVIAEWLGGFEGLGVYMTRVRKAYAFDKMFAVIILVVIVSLLLMKLVTIIRNAAMPWLRYRQEGTGSN